MSSRTPPSFSKALFTAGLFLVGCASQAPDIRHPATGQVEVPVVETASEQPPASATESAGDDSKLDTPAAARSDLDALASLVSGYEGPGPSAESLRAASPTPVASLIALSKDSSLPGAVRQGATRALSTLGGDAAHGRLAELLASGAAPDLKRAALQAVTPLPDSFYAAALGLLQDSNVGVARAAVLALATTADGKTELAKLDASSLAPAVRTAVDDALGRARVSPTPVAVPIEGPPSRGGR